jgi:peptidoglycan/LPS O-acetylase OafA/YrhL
MDRPRKQIHALTGLRFLAAFGVVLNHLPRVPEDPWLARFARFFAEGGAGVPFFFVLSGFVLTFANHGRLVRPAPGTSRRYLAGRVARIFPLHWLTLFAAVWLSTVPLRPVPGPVWHGLRFAANALLVQGFIPDPAYYAVYNSLSWTLSCELFFYLLLPLALRGTERWLARPGRLLAATGVALVVPLLLARTLIKHPERFDYLWPLYLPPIVQLPTFLAGVFLGRLFLLRPRRPVAHVMWSATLAEAATVGCLLLAVTQAYRVHWLYRMYGSYVPVMAGIVWLFAREEGALSRLLATRPCVYLGDVSFALYMVHGMTLSNVDLLLTGKLRPAWSAVIGFAVALLISAICHRWYEGPMRKIVNGLLVGRSQPPNFAAGAVRKAA